MVKKVILVFLLVLSFVFTDNVNAEDYEIESFDTNIIVNENNSYDVYEHLKININRLYKRFFPFSSSISNVIHTNTNMSFSNDNRYYEFHVNGAIDNNRPVTISYTYKNLYDNKFYFDLTGRWDTTIKNVSFSITMPKDFDASKISFNDNNITYNVDGNKITGKYLKPLDEGKELEASITLPDGYFKSDKSKSTYNYYIAILITILLLVIAIIFYIKYGKEEEIIKPVTVYPPDNINSLEAGFLYKGYADERDVTSLLIYLANKGYIKVIAVENKTELSLYDNNYYIKFQKLKEYDGNNKYEKEFMDELFGDNDEVDNGVSSVSTHIILDINKQENKDKVICSAPTSVKVSLLFITGIVILINFIFPYIIFSVMPDILPLGTILFVAAYFLIKPSDNRKVFHKETTIGNKLLGSSFIFIIFVIISIPLIIGAASYVFITSEFIAIISIIIIYNIYGLLSKRTAYGREMLGKLLAFKEFLELAEKEKLEALVNDNPNYFYDILPYTYVLDVSNEWIKKFDSLIYTSPDWFSSHGEFKVKDFVNNMNGIKINIEDDKQKNA